MTKHKSTKRALLLSGLALFACISMLVGSTFAWFTDSVTSANNIITSGNLDIVLEYWNGNSWEDVSGKSNILSEDLYEPGYVQVAYLRLKNAGSLALKYQLGVNIVDEKAGTNMAGEQFYLSDHIQFAALESDALVKYDTRAAAIAAADGKSAAIKAGYTKAASMLAGEELYVALVVYMPETVGNVANHNGKDIPQIDLGINVYATQYTYEEDSFDKYYDGAAEWLGGIDTTWYNETDNEFVIGSAEELAGLAQIVNTAKDSFAGKTVKLVSNINLNNLEWAPIGDVDADAFVGFQGTFDGQGYAIANLKIESDSWGQGLFGYATKAFTVQNVNIHNANVKAADTCGIIAGWADLAILSNIHVTGDVSVIGTSDAAEAGHVGGIIGRGYSATIENCSVIANAGSSITSAGSFVGGIAGYQCNYTKAITGCTVKNVAITGESSVGGIAGIIASGTTFANNAVENVVLTKIRVGGYPKIGALIGCYDGSKDTALANCSVKDVTLNGSNEAYPAYNELYGAGYDAKATAKFDVDSVAVNGITNNLVEVTVVSTSAQLDAAVKAGATSVYLAPGEYDVYGCGGKTLTISGTKDAIIKVANEGEAGSDYGFDGSTVTFNGITFDTSANNGNYKGFARMVGTYNNCTFEGSYALNKDSVFTGCTFNVSGDSYNIWTWGAPNATFDGCTFNSDGKSVLLYGGVDTKLTVNNCVFNDKGGLSDLKAAVEIGHDYGRSYELIVNNTTVNGYEINDKGINTGSTLWGNKNSMGTDKLNVVIDGVDVY